MRLTQSGIILALVSFTIVGAVETNNDGTCGNGVSCMGSLFGGCCSADGRCGASVFHDLYSSELMFSRTPKHCGAGCQIKYGFCQNTWGKPSPDGTCGGRQGFVCKNSGFGDCCSEYNFCGSEEGHCGPRCQRRFGNCKTPTDYESLGLQASELPNTISSGLVATSAWSSSTPAQNSAHETPSAIREEVYRRAQHTGPYKTAPLCPSIDNSVFEAPCGAQFQVQCATDRSGGDIHMNTGNNGFYVETVQDCLEACASYPGCINVAWVKGLPKGACYIKNKIGPSITNEWVHGGVLVRNCTSTSSPPVSTATSSDSSGDLTINSTHRSTPSITAAVQSINSTTLGSAFWTNSTEGLSITTLIPTAHPNTASTLSTRMSQPSSACTAQPTVINGDDCVPCEGQSGSLPFCGADVTTDNYKFTPKTCRTVKYTLDITNTTVAPDGRSRIALLVNGQLPGPLIEANWGDTVEVTVNNKMQNNGTTIHFHGIRQLNNSEYDGELTSSQDST